MHIRTYKSIFLTLESNQIMNSDENSSDPSEMGFSKKKHYQQPSLTCYGTIEKLTLAGNGPTVDNDQPGQGGINHSSRPPGPPFS